MKKYLIGNEYSSHSASKYPNREYIYTFSVVVTGRCNAACTYCHYYESHDRKLVEYDISDDLFETYMDFIHHWSKEVPGRISYRFSGGDPMVLGDRLFALADIGLKKTSMRPFVLTAGKALGREWVNRARNSAFSHVFVSVENPIRPDPGAPNPFKVVQMIQKYNSLELPIVPGVCVIPNDCFKHIYEICNWFYREVGSIPLICEKNYSLYQSPTEDEWRALEDCIPEVIKDFFPKTQLNIFSSVVPEYAYGGQDPYLFELNLENSHGLDQKNYKDKIDWFMQHLENANYPRLHCHEAACPWLKFCGNTKWYWQGDKKNSMDQKIRDYCRLKRILSDAYFRVLIDPTHPATNCAVKQSVSPSPPQADGALAGGHRGVLLDKDATSVAHM